MISLIMFLVGFALGCFALYFLKDEGDIIYEEYFSNTGNKCYRIYKIEYKYEKGKKVKYEIYLGEVEE